MGGGGMLECGGTAGRPGDCRGWGQQGVGMVGGGASGPAGGRSSKGPVDRGGFTMK